MQLSNEKIKACNKRILLSRFRILNDYGFYGLMLMHMKYGLDNDCDTAYTDGDKICFSPEFLDELSDSELDFVMMHEISHVALKHCFRGLHYNQHLFNIACDIVVNSNILKSKGMNLDSITLKKYGTSMHLAPDGQEGYLYTAEQVYEMLLNNMVKSFGKTKKGKGKNNGKGDDSCDPDQGDGTTQGNSLDGLDSLDDHSKWQGKNKEKEEEWDTRIISAVESEKKKTENGRYGNGSVPMGVIRLVDELTDSTVNWRALLNDFIQTDITDYSFMPPDRRYQGDFYLPDFNVPEDNVEDVLFMVDTSGSIDTHLLTESYSEIAGAIEQFNGKLNGKVGFFDQIVYKPIEFTSKDELLQILPKGGGGTSFYAVFNYVKSLNEKPACVIILTDGYAEFPKEPLDVPILWLINNNEVTPPYGIVARILQKV